MLTGPVITPGSGSPLNKPALNLVQGGVNIWPVIGLLDY